MKLRWIGQSGYILSDDKNSICIDPYLSDAVGRIAGRARLREIPIKPSELKVDAVVCTHNHLDHVDIDAIPEMSRNIEFYAPSDCKSILTELGVVKYNRFDEGMEYELGKFKLRAVFADHTVPAIGVQVIYGDQILYFTGDTFYNSKLEGIACDYLFVCINGRLGNMNVKEAVRLARILNPKTAIPNHYDMFESNSEDPNKFTEVLENGCIMEFNKEYEVKDGCLI